MNNKRRDTVWPHPLGDTGASRVCVGGAAGRVCLLEPFTVKKERHVSSHTHSHTTLDVRPPHLTLCLALPPVFQSSRMKWGCGRVAWELQDESVREMRGKHAWGETKACVRWDESVREKRGHTRMGSARDRDEERKLNWRESGDHPKSKKPCRARTASTKEKEGKKREIEREARGKEEK